MFQKQSRYSKKWLLFVAGLLILWLLFRPKKSNDRIIREIIERSNYRQMADLIVAQAKHETKGYRSAIFNENNNFFGMKMPEKRQTKAVGINRNHAVYKSKSDSVKDYLLWLDYNKFPIITRADVFVTELKRKRYFTDTIENYTKGIVLWLGK